MARIRSVHPSLFTDEAWVACSPLARILYIGLMCEADDQGLFEWKPLQVKMRVLPGDTSDVPALLAELVEVNLIAQLDAGGKKLGAIRYFRRFQRPKKPNAHFVLPPEWRTYVGLSDDGSELEGDEGEEVRNQFPTDTEISPQMEDGGGRREEASASGGSPEPTAKPKAVRKKPATGIPDGFPDAGAIAEQQAKAQAAGANVNAVYEAERFRNWAISKGQTYADWPAAWRNWMLKPITEAPRPNGGSAVVVGVWSGPPEVRSVVLKSLEKPDYADSYLRHCTADTDHKVLETENGFAADVLRKQCGRNLSAIGWRVQVKAKAA